MESNPYNLGPPLDEKPSNYIDGDELFDLFKKNKIPLADKDNLPRFCNANDIKMQRLKRVGSGGTTPHIYKIPSQNKLEEIRDKMKNTTSSILGKKILIKKKAKILEIFDKAIDKTETKSSIADKVTKILGVSCNRKLVSRLLDSKRASKLEKLKRVS